PCGPRSRRPAGRCGTPRRGRCSTRAMPAELIYGTHAVREALRGQRQVLRVWCTRRAGEQSDWLPDDAIIETAERLDGLAAGAVEHLPIALVENLADALLRARRPGLWTYAADADGDSPYDGNDYRDGTLFVLGAEGRGLRPRVRAACDAAAAIPMRGRIESLN